MSASAPSSAPLMLSVSGMRGIVGKSLTPDVLCRYAAAAAEWMRETSKNPDQLTVVIANDGRKGGEALRNCVAWALVAAGCRVCDIGVAATPTVGVMVDHLKADGALTLTASHNPGEWNGVKVITREGAAPDAASAAKIIARFHANSGGFAAADAFGRLERVDGADDIHVERVLQAISAVCDFEAIRDRKFRVVVDSVNASGAGVARKLLSALNCDLIHLHAEQTGVFPHTPEPTAENLANMCAQVASKNAAVGFAQDPDADRLALLDEAGRYIGEEYTLALAVMSLLGAGINEVASRSGGVGGVHLAANLSTSRMIDDVAAKFGATMHRAAVGEANVVSAMREFKATIGGEGNGGVIWPTVTWIRDSVGAMALVLALMTRENKPLSQIVASIPSYAIEKRKAPIREGLTEKALKVVEAHYRAQAGAKLDTQDGIRADFPSPMGRGQAWVHVRASNTEPIIRFIAEAPTVAEASSILDQVAQVVAKA